MCNYCRNYGQTIVSFGASFEPKSMTTMTFVCACILLTFWASAINNTHTEGRAREKEKERWFKKSKSWTS